ncbi:MAG: proprotein convertase P-domain-containing protein [Bacteroidota bacterium]
MQLFYPRLLCLVPFCLFCTSLYAQVFQGQTNVIIPPGAPSQTVGISESEAVVTGVGPLTGCRQVERVLVNMTHTWTGDIGLFLISPAGTVLELSTRNGGSQNDYLNTEFRDDAAQFITDGAPPFTGTFRPEGRQQDINNPNNINALGTFTLASTFAGENADGTWTFLVNDYVAADVGEILNWEIEFSGDPNGTIDVDLGPDLSVCGSNPTVLSATVTPADPGAIYSWSTGATTPTISVTPTTPTIYSVTVTSGGCTDTDDILVTPGSGSPVTITSNPPTICAGESATLTASGGGPGATYTWSTGQSGSSITVSPTTDETFSVTLTEAGCTTTDDLLVEVEETITASLEAVGNPEGCTGEPIALEIIIDGGDNAGPYTINVDNPNGVDFNLPNVLLSDGDIIPFSLTFDQTTTITFSITPQGSACPVTLDPAQLTITISGPVVMINGPASICPGDPVTLTASGADTYSWSTAESTPSITDQPLITTTYTVTGTTAGCSVTEDFTVTVLPPNPTVASSPQQICAGQSSTLSVTDVGPAATYQWSTGQSGASINVTPATTTTYQVTVTEGPCSVIGFISVLVDPAATADLSIVGPDEVCAGETIDLLVNFNGGTNIGPFDLTIQNPNGPDFTINNFSGTGNPDFSAPFTVNETTTFTLVIVPTSGCSATVGQASVTVTVNDAPNVQISGTTEVCPGETVTLAASGADSYQWSTGQSGPSITFTPFDGQSVSVIGTTNGCDGQAQELITVTPLNALITPSQPSICAGESITLGGSGGSASAVYSWSTGQNGPQITLSPSTSETVTLTVTDGSCTDTQDFVVVVNSPPSVSVDEDFSVCAGLPADLTATGGSFSATYQWSTGQSGSTIPIFPLTTTTYTVTVSENGCTNTDQVTVSVEDSPALELGNNQDICLGDNLSLFNQANGTGTYQWSTGAIAPAINVNPTQSEIYAVTLTDGNCSSEDQILVTVTDPSFDLGPAVSICPGESISLTADGPGSFLWSTGQTGNSIVVSPSQTETFSVTRTLNGCTATDDIEVAVLAAPSVSAGIDETICAGESIILTASGTGPFSWSTGEVADQISVSPSTTTTYTVTAGGSACQATDEVTVFVEPGPSVELGPDQQICAGEQLTLSTNVAGDSYAWSTGSNQPSITISPAEAAVYTLNVTANGCTGTDSVAVSILDFELDAGPDQTICPGESVTLQASGADTYSWANGPNTAAFEVNPTQTTTYLLSGATAGCTAQDSVTVNVVLNTSVNIAPQAPICPGDSVLLTATGTGPFSWSTGEVADQIWVRPATTITYLAEAGAGACRVVDSIQLQVQPPIPLDLGPDTTICAGQDLSLELAIADAQYQWSNGSTSGSTNYAPLAPETASVSVTVNGCTTTDSLRIDINDPTLVVSNDTTVCPGDEVELLASGTDSYLWSTSATTAGIVVNPTTSTTYSVQGTTGNCPVTEEVTVNMSIPGSVDLGEDPTICPGEEVSLTASGSGPFSWSTGEQSDEIRVSPTSSQTYFATTGIGNCLQADSLEVFVLPQVLASLGPDTTICAGEELTLTAQGTPGDYLWSTNEVSPSINVSPTDTTTYSLITTANGCTDTTEIVVAVNAPAIEISEDQTTCPGDEVQLTASGTANFSWSTGEETASISVSPAETEAFTVIGTDEACSVQASVTVEVLPLASLTVIDSQSICIGESVTLTANSDASLLWNTGAEESSISVSPASTTTYTVVAGEGNCAVTDSIVVEVRPLPAVDIVGELAACAGTLVSLQAAGTPGSTYLWSTGENTDAIDFPLVENTEISLTADLSGCTASTSISLTALALPQVLNADPICAEDNATYQWNIELGGGSAPYFSNGVELSGNLLSSPSINSGDSLLVNFTDANGCATSFAASNACGCLVLPLASPAPRCTEDTDPLDLDALLPQGAPAGSWTVVNGPEDLLINGNELLFDGATAGTYRIGFVPEGSTAACLAEYQIELMLAAPASAGLQTTPLTLCKDELYSIDLATELDGFTPGGSWTAGSDNVQDNPAFDPALGRFSIRGQASGTYRFRYRPPSTGPCPATDSEVIINIQEVLVEAQASSANCLSDCSGTIIIVNLDPLLLYGLDEAALSAATQFTSLCPGSYRIVAEDPAGCQSAVELLVEAPILPVLEAGADRELLLGDSIRLNVQTNAVDGLISWSPEVVCLDASCQEVILRPLRTTRYTLELVDAFGCTVQDDLQLLVDRNRTTYAPTAFSPNGDGINDRFTIYGDAGVVSVSDLGVYDRWGNQVFFLSELPLNQESAGWDGKAKGRMLDPAVFVYQYRINWADGREEIVRGEVTLIR